MIRPLLAPDHGMLLVLPDAKPHWFWMTDALIPLDILFFDACRRLAPMQLDVPPCRTTPCTNYPSSMPARYALEVPAGTVSRIGASVGDTLTVDTRLAPVR